MHPNNTTIQAVKRAAIYIRTSTQQQADKVSPQAQEEDCRAYCAARGYQVVKVYRDTERYKAGGRMVEPSATRADRPQYKRMLADCDAGAFDVLVAWRVDRLYRGVNRAMLEIGDRVKAGKLTVETVKDTFDVRTMEVLAWAAGIELEARRDRHRMGMAARYASGRLSLAYAPYGYNYDRDTGTLSINEEEAAWVRQIWSWYAEGVGRYEIRRRLIAADAPQAKKSPVKRRHRWHPALIDKMLTKDMYATGIFEVKWAGNTYEIPIPAIIDAETYEAVQARRQSYQAYPKGNLRESALVAGLIYCEACGTRMGCRTNRAHGRIYRHYTCQAHLRRTSQPGCAKGISMAKVDGAVWSTVWRELSEPGRFEMAIQERIEQLRAQENDATEDIASLERQLGDLALERQRVITMARKAMISESDLETQLFDLDLQKRLIERELSERRLLLGSQADRLAELAAMLRQRVTTGLATLAPGAPETPEQFKQRRKLVEALVTRVTVTGDKSLKIGVELGLSSIEGLRDDSVLVEHFDTVYINGGSVQKNVGDIHHISLTFEVSPS